MTNKWNNKNYARNIVINIKIILIIVKKGDIISLKQI